MSEPTIRDMFNLPHAEIEFRGQKYPLRDLSIVEEGTFAQWLIQEARDAIYRDSSIDEARQDRQAKLVNDAAAAGLYDWGSPASLEAMGTLKGIAQCLHIMLKKEHPEVTARYAVEMVREKHKEIMLGFVQEAATDPKVRAALETMGFITPASSAAGSPPSSTPLSEVPPISMPLGT